MVAGWTGGSANDVSVKFGCLDESIIVYLSPDVKKLGRVSEE